MPPRRSTAAAHSGRATRPAPVRRVGIVDVHPAEPLARRPIDPRIRDLDDRVGAPLGLVEVRRRADFGDLVVVRHRSRRLRPNRFSKHERADEGARGEAERLQPRRHRGNVRPESIANVVADAVLVGIQAGEDRRVRGQRQDGRRVREREARAMGGQPIEVRCRGRPAVGAERVGAQRVDRHEQDVLVRSGRSTKACSRHHHQPPPRSRR